MAKQQLTAVRYFLDRDQLEVIAKNKAGEEYQMTHTFTIDRDEDYVDDEFVYNLVFFATHGHNPHKIHWMPIDFEAFTGDENWIELEEKEPITVTINRSKKVIETGKQLLNERAA